MLLATLSILKISQKICTLVAHKSITNLPTVLEQKRKLTKWILLLNTLWQCHWTNQRVLDSKHNNLCNILISNVLKTRVIFCNIQFEMTFTVRYQGEQCHVTFDALRLIMPQRFFQLQSACVTRSRYSFENVKAVTQESHSHTAQPFPKKQKWGTNNDNTQRVKSDRKYPHPFVPVDYCIIINIVPIVLLLWYSMSGFNEYLMIQLHRQFIKNRDDFFKFSFSDDNVLHSILYGIYIKYTSSISFCQSI